MCVIYTHLCVHTCMLVNAQITSGLIHKTQVMMRWGRWGIEAWKSEVGGKLHIIHIIFAFYIFTFTTYPKYSFFFLMLEWQWLGRRLKHCDKKAG